MKRSISITVSCLSAMAIAASLLACGETTSTSSGTSADSATSSVEESTAADTSEESAVASTSNDEKVTIRFAWWGSQDRTDRTVKALDLYTELHPNVTFETEPTDWSGYWDKLATQAATGSLPDMYQMDYGYLATYYNQNLLLNLQPYIDDSTIDVSRITDSVLQSGSFDNNLYAMCAGLNCPCLFYDKEIVDQAGITIPDQMTWDEFYSDAQTIYDKTGVGAYVDSMILGMLFRGKGLTEFNEDGSAFGVDNADTFTQYYQMIADATSTDWELSPEILTEKDPTVTETMPILDQTAWNSFSNSNQLSTISSTSGRELGITMWPTCSDDTVQTQYLKSSQFFCGYSKTEHPEIVVDVINFLTSNKDANAILAGERGVPVDSDIVAALKPTLSDEDKVVYDFVDKVSEVATPMDPPAPSGSSEIGTLVNDFTEQVRYGQISAEEAGQSTFDQGNDILSEESSKAE